MTNRFQPFEIPYQVNPKYSKKTAYFCMEYGIDSALKIYSGGLGYLAGSHLRSAYALRQNFIGIGILWKYGYYDQTRKSNGEMDALFMERDYNFLVDTGIEFPIPVNGHPVMVKVWYLPPEVFKTAPLFLLSTIHPANDYLAQTTCHRLYSNNTEAKIAQYLLLGVGGAKLLDILGYKPDIYHLNEAHALPALFHLYRHTTVLDQVRQRAVFTTHTPVEAGNEKHDIHLLERMGFFADVPLHEVRRITGMDGNVFNMTLAGLRLSGMANGVSKIHGEVARRMWEPHGGTCPITHITNAQNKTFWHDETLTAAMESGNVAAYEQRKKELKKQLFQIVADQTGKIFDPDVLTMVWARRYADYKRADLITRDLERFEALVKNQDRPIQIIWAGKPYPNDDHAIGIFNSLVHLSKRYKNVAVVTGYEISLSKALKQGSDVWLNNPRLPREASGTSGMTAAMNGSVNLSTLDGWIPEFAKHGHNAFVVPQASESWPVAQQDEYDRINIMRVLEGEILPLYYSQPDAWRQIAWNSMREVVWYFDSDRMAAEYYEKLYAKTPVGILQEA